MKLNLTGKTVKSERGLLRIKNIEEAAQEAKIEEFVPDEQDNLRQNADAIDSSSEEEIEEFVPENLGGLPSEVTRNPEGALSQEPTLDNKPPRL